MSSRPPRTRRIGCSAPPSARMAVLCRTVQISPTHAERGMRRSKATSVAEYLGELSADSRKAITTVRKVIRDNLPDGYDETVNWGMISYEIPLSRYSSTYNKRPLSYLALAAQKNYNAIYM